MPSIAFATPSVAHLHDITAIGGVENTTTVIMGLTVTVALNVGRPILESFSVSHSVASHRIYNRSVGESIEISGSPTRFKRANNLIEDSFTIVDESIRRLVQSKAVTELLSITDIIGRTTFISRTLAESFTVVASAIGERLTFHTRSVADSIAITEDGFAEICTTVGVLKKIIRHQLGRFFSVLPQRNIRSYTFHSNLIREKEKQQ